MKQIFISLTYFLFLSTSILTAQRQPTRFEFGIGGTGEFHFFNPTADYSFTGLEPKVAFLGGGNVFLAFNPENKFQFRLNGHLGYKRLRLENEYELPPSGIIEERARIYFNSFDISALSLYNIPLKDNKVFQPVFGIFTSFSRQSGFGSGLGARGDFSGSGLAFEDIPRFIDFDRGFMILDDDIFHVGVNLGLNYRFFILSRFPVEFMVLGYLSPFGIFETEVGYSGVPETNILKGRYHHLTVGVNIPFKIFPPEKESTKSSEF